MFPENLISFIAENTWTFAKTMPEKPHSYVVRERCNSDADFVSLVEFIRANGEKRPFFNTWYIYLEIGEYKYWTGHCKINKAYPSDPDYTNIINRAKI